MIFLELACSNVRGFSSGRFSLRPGYLSLKPAQPGAIPLAGIALALAYADGRGSDAIYAAPGSKGAKAGLTILGNDQVTYRLVRDLGGAGALHRLNKATKAFEVVTEDANEAGQFLRTQVGFPTRAAFDQVYTFTGPQFPTRRQKKKGDEKKPGGVSGPKPQLATALPVAAASDVAAAQARLKELEREHALSKEVADLQFRQDGISSQLFELESKLKGTEGLRAALTDAESAFAKAPTPESLNLPKDIISRAERYPDLVKRRDEALAKLDAEREAYADTGSVAVAPQPLYRDQRFLAAAAAGVFFFGLGAMLHGYARYVALLDIPLFGFAAVLALKFIDDLQAGSRVSRKGDVVASREKKLREDFDAEIREIKAAMHLIGVETPEELIHALSQRPLLGEKVEELRAQLRQFEQDPQYASASAKAAQLKAEAEAINAQLLEKGGYVRDAREVEREIERVKESIAKAKGGGSAAEPTFSAVPTGGGEALEDPMPALFILGADLLHIDVPSVGPLLKDRCVQYVSALTDRRYHGIEFDKDGKTTVLAPGRKIAAGELPGKDLDLVYLSVRLTLIEKHGAAGKIPVLIEDCLSVVDEPKWTLMGRMLKHIGTLTQVLHVTNSPALQGMTDAVVSI